MSEHLANDQAEGELDNDGASSTEFGPSARSVSGHYTAFGQVSETTRDVDAPANILMIRTDSTPVISHRRRSSAGHDPSFYIAGTGAVRTPSIASSSHAQSSTVHGREAIQYRSQNPSYDDDPFARGPPTHSSSQVASSYFDPEIGSSSGQRRSMEATRQKSTTPPGSSSHIKLASVGSERSFKRMLGRLRSRSSPTPDSAAQDVDPPASLSRRPTSPSIHGSGALLSSPSSLLRPQSPITFSSVHRPAVTPFDPGEYSWPGSGPLTLPPSPAASEESCASGTPRGLLNPRFDQARMDSTASFGDHVDVSRRLIPQVAHASSTMAYDTDDSVERREA